jgi:predicted acylesterase/phospholipase RssA
MLCVTRSEISKPDVLRNYESLHPSAENYNCKIWEATSATAAAPIYFKGVQFGEKGEKWCDGGLRRNNPINEALAELARERDWKDKKIGCILSIGTGVAKISSVSSNLAGILKGALEIMTDSDDTARIFASSERGLELFRAHRYFRFSVPQGMQHLELDDWKETEKMSALTTDYLAHAANGDMLERCAKSLLDTDENCESQS